MVRIIPDMTHHGLTDVFTGRFSQDPSKITAKIKGIQKKNKRRFHQIKQVDRTVRQELMNDP